MDRDSGIVRFFIGFLVVVAVVLLAVLLLRGGGEEERTPVSVDQPRDITISDYANRDTRVALTIEGRIVGDYEHRQIRISVDRNQRVLEVIQGFQGNVIQSQRFANNSDALEAFLFALHREGFGDYREVEQEDVRGVCPRGKRYIFEVYEGDRLLNRLWATDCSRRLGTFGGDRGDVVRLFQDQITDYNQLTRGVQL